MTEVYIALGSNLNSPVDQINQAVDTISNHPEITVEAISSFYENPPMGPQDQPDFVNAVIKINTFLSVRALLDFLQSIEKTQNREKKIRWGTRTIDADILLYGMQKINETDLVIPHLGLIDRAFFVGPLLEIAPDLVLPNQMALKKIAEKLDFSILTKINREEV